VSVESADKSARIVVRVRSVHGKLNGEVAGHADFRAVGPMEFKLLGTPTSVGQSYPNLRCVMNDLAYPQNNGTSRTVPELAWAVPH